MKTFTSLVRGYEGECSPTWLDGNSVSMRIIPRTTGFFKPVKKGWFGIKYRYGKEFHGYIGSDLKIRTTKGIYDTSQLI